MHFCREFSPLLYTNAANLMQKELIYLSEANYLSQISRRIKLRYTTCQCILLSHHCENSDIFRYLTLRCQASKSSSSPISLLVLSTLVMNFRSFPFPSSLGPSTEKKENWYIWNRFSTLGLFAAWKEHQDHWHPKIIEWLGYFVLRFSV